MFTHITAKWPIHSIYAIMILQITLTMELLYYYHHSKMAALHYVHADVSSDDWVE
jgi:hypothetical protein